MASPQTENGYTKIANELLDAMCRVPMSGHEWSVLNAVIRKTYGYNKKEDWIANSQICEMTGLTKNRVWDAKKKLLEKSIVTKNGNLLALNKDYEEWSGYRKSGTTENDQDEVKVPGKRYRVPEKRYKSTAKAGTQKTKDNIQKKEGTSNEVSPLAENKNKTMSWNLPNENTADETFVDYESGEEIQPKPKKENKSKEVMSLLKTFKDMAEKETGVRPPETKGEYFALTKAMKAHKLDKEDVQDLFTYFFADSKMAPEKKINIGLCISGVYISQWNVVRSNKQVTQVDAASEILL